MKCSILAIGTEVVSGDIVNTNAVFIANYLKKFGVKTISHMAVEDEQKDIVKAIRRGLKKADLVITTGGLGPTYDDITKKAVAAALERELVRDEYSVEMLNAYFRRTGKTMTANNLNQCFFPKGSTIIQNPNGTAPACITETKKGTVIMLPGPPNEMKPLMASEEITEYLNRHKTEEILETTIKLFGIGESLLEEKLSEYMSNQENLILAPYAKTGEVQLKITATGKTLEEVRNLTDGLKEKLYETVGEHIYAESDVSLEEVLLSRLKETNQTIVTAESCTGGLIAQKLTALSGASENFLGGVVTYSNELKMMLCGVRATTLSEYGAVSKGVACEMAEGARKKFNADIAVSVTGIAGPTGGTEEKPVGLVYIGVSTRDMTDAFRFHFAGNREKVREISAKNALYLALKYSK